MRREKRHRNYTPEQYETALRLLQTLSLRRVSKILGIPRATLYKWRRGSKPPLTQWRPEPGKELAYVLGALLGDGAIIEKTTKRGKSYWIKLNVVDYEFAYEFSRALAIVLNKPMYQPRWIKSIKQWRVIYSSKAFCHWYKSLLRLLSQGDLSKLRQYVEHDKETVKAFLRGIFDADGGHIRLPINRRYIHLDNTNLALLRYIQYLLLNYYSIPMYIVHHGKTRSGKHYYSLVTGQRFYVQKFLNEIGFTILRKQLGLPKLPRELLK